MDLTALQYLSYLNYIDLDWNSITDLTPLDTNANYYGNAVYVSLNGNSYLSNNQITIAPEMMTLVYDNWTVNYNVQFGDEGLQNAIQTVLLNSHILTPCDCSTYPITPNDMATLATLDVSDYPINSVEGLEFCTSLNTLDLEWNQISDLTPLSDLTGLYSLNLAHNQISNLTGLDNLTNLYDLDLSYNQIQNGGDINNLGHLANMTNLNYLGLDFNNISDFTSLFGPNGLPSLIELEISGNQITSIPSPLYNDSERSLVPSLQNLYLEANQITDLYPLEDLADTTEASYVNLYVTGNPISLQDCGVFSEVNALQNTYYWTVWGYDYYTAAGHCD